MESQMSKGIRILREQGHLIERRIQDGKTWWVINQQTLATREEFQHLADGIYSPSELIELYTKRRAQEEAAEIAGAGRDSLQ
jgi:hypothetical protein